MNRTMHLLNHLTDHYVSTSLAPLIPYLYLVNSIHLPEELRYDNDGNVFKPFISLIHSLTHVCTNM